MTTIEDLEERINSLEESLIQMAKNNAIKTEKIDETSNRIDAITPYKDAKTAYYGEKEKTFYDVPMGNISISFSNYNGSYSVNRIGNRVVISFDALIEQTDITMSIQ